MACRRSDTHGVKRQPQLRTRLVNLLEARPGVDAPRECGLNVPVQFDAVHRVPPFHRDSHACGIITARSIAASRPVVNGQRGGIHRILAGSATKVDTGAQVALDHWPGHAIIGQGNFWLRPGLV